MSISGLPDEMTLVSIERRLRCEKCGTLGKADFRPAWGENSRPTSGAVGWMDLAHVINTGASGKCIGLRRLLPGAEFSDLAVDGRGERAYNTKKQSGHKRRKN
jgi:hypothetical protein